MSRPEERSVLQRLFEIGEERVTSFTDELLSNPGFSEALENVFRSALQTKGRVNRNMETVLDILNVPPKADYERLATKVDALQGSFVNLNVKLNRTAPRNSATPFLIASRNSCSPLPTPAQTGLLQRTDSPLSLRGAITARTARFERSANLLPTSPDRARARPPPRVRSRAGFPP